MVVLTASEMMLYNKGGLNDTQFQSQAWAIEQFCYLTTAGRKTGNPHTIEIWFAAPPDSQTLYMLSGGGEKADWVRNILNNPQVRVRLGEQTFSGRGRVVEDGAEALLARKLVVAKYYSRDYDPQGGWEANSLPVAIDLAR